MAGRKEHLNSCLYPISDNPCPSVVKNLVKMGTLSAKERRDRKEGGNLLKNEIEMMAAKRHIIHKRARESRLCEMFCASCAFCGHSQAPPSQSVGIYGQAGFPLCSLCPHSEKSNKESSQ